MKCSPCDVPLGLDWREKVAPGAPVRCVREEEGGRG